jgi:hypothetical protein
VTLTLTLVAALTSEGAFSLPVPSYWSANETTDSRAVGSSSSTFIVLMRQLMTAVKALLHNVKLHVLCVSRANTPMRPTKVADDAELRPAGRRSTSAHRCDT